MTTPKIENFPLLVGELLRRGGIMTINKRPPLGFYSRVNKRFSRTSLRNPTLEDFTDQPVKRPDEEW
jgi:hypothetical protein